MRKGMAAGRIVLAQGLTARRSVRAQGMAAGGQNRLGGAVADLMLRLRKAWPLGGVRMRASSQSARWGCIQPGGHPSGAG